MRRCKMPFEKIGVLWKKQSKNGKQYLSGNITLEGVRVHIWVLTNEFRKNNKQPEYNIFLTDESQTKNDPDPTEEE
jgi:hypothetical protein